MTFEDHEIDPSLREERERELREQELARRIRREVRRVASGEAADDIREDERLERDEQEQAERTKARKRRGRTLSMLFTGSILERREVKRLYPYLMCVAVMMFLCIFVLFTTLRLDIRRARLEAEVDRLHERAVRLSEQAYRATSREAVIRELDRRGIMLEERPMQTKVIE